MRNNIIQPLVAAGVLLGAAFTVTAVPVTFQVNMYFLSSLGTFDPVNGIVKAHGSFNGWGAGLVLTNSPSNPEVYSGTTDVTLAAGTRIAYKFVYKNNPTDGDHWEANGVYAVSDRLFKLGSSAQTLPLAYWNDTWDGLPIPVTFQVDMSVQQAAGNFDPLIHTVEARGKFNGWSSGFVLTNSPAKPSIYSGGFDFVAAPGATVEYKFVYYLPPSSNADKWESFSNNRYLALTNPETVLPVAYYNDASGFPIKAAVYFQVNLAAQVLNGTFDPLTDQVYARGNILGWGDPPAGLHLLEDAARPGIYTNIYTMSSFVTGDLFTYKLTIWKTATSTTIWESGGDKQLVFTGSEPVIAGGYHLKTVGPVYFDNASPYDLLPEDTLVTFQVNMDGAVGYGGSPTFAPASMGVWINGTMLPNGWNTYGTWGTMPPETRMYDDGSNGDEVAGDKIYSWQQMVPKGKAVRIQYKYGIDSNDNEAPSGSDHVRYIRATGNYVMPLDQFGSIVQEPEVGTLTIGAPSRGYVTVSWNGRPGVRLQSSGGVSSGVWTDVPGSDGASSAVVTVGSTPQFFRLIKP